MGEGGRYSGRVGTYRLTATSGCADLRLRPPHDGDRAIPHPAGLPATLSR